MKSSRPKSLAGRSTECPGWWSEPSILDRSRKAKTCAERTLRLGGVLLRAVAPSPARGGGRWHARGRDGEGADGREGSVLVTRLLRPNGPPGRGQAPPLLWVSADGRREKGLGGTMPVDKNDLPVPPPLADPGRLAEARG